MCRFYFNTYDIDHMGRLTQPLPNKSDQWKYK